MKSKTLNNQSGNLILIVVLLTTLVFGSFLYLGTRYQLITRDLLRQTQKNSLDSLNEYLLAHTDCVTTKTQACTNPVALLKKDGTVFLTSSEHAIGAYKIQSLCSLPTQAILYRYVAVDAPNFSQGKQEVLCPAP